MKPTANKIKPLNELKPLIKQWQEGGDEVVFTNGCFDILHLGHIDYLEKSKELGDKLVVGLNSDNSVRKIKGEERPLNNEYSRARILAALSFVDAVILFSEDTPKELISQLLPDILVKGNDYLAENIVGADIVKAHGGRVETISLVDGYSTTNIVEKIKKLK
ncbi:D-glycero-beta-D-manno-heptose 1-phosphate adenylyltransferase [Fulvivirga sp.]|uniref:D-glycero-beta-D-manno-heptose 1-phosphate adenylyltransferase n=1 Tax=Fulvivirga sp. TaxID=1931237 RepID=UPI0032ED0588